MAMLPFKAVNLIYRVSNCCYKQDKSPEPLCALCFCEPKYTAISSGSSGSRILNRNGSYQRTSDAFITWPHSLHKTNAKRGLILLNTARQNIMLYSHLVPGIYHFECVAQEPVYGGGKQR